MSERTLRPAEELAKERLDLQRKIIRDEYDKQMPIAIEAIETAHAKGATHVEAGPFCDSVVHALRLAGYRVEGRTRPVGVRSAHYITW